MDNRIKYLQRVIEENEISLPDAQEALDHHLRQLSRLGATLEDDVCSVLRKVIAQAEARKEIQELNEALREITPF